MALSGSIAHRRPGITAECQNCVGQTLDARTRMLSLSISAVAPCGAVFLAGQLCEGLDRFPDQVGERCVARADQHAAPSVYRHLQVLSLDDTLFMEGSFSAAMPYGCGTLTVAASEDTPSLCSSQACERRESSRKPQEEARKHVIVPFCHHDPRRSI